MRFTALALLAAVLPLTAVAQPTIVRAPTAAPAPPAIDRPTIAAPAPPAIDRPTIAAPAPPLTPAGAQRIQRRLAAYTTTLRGLAPRADSLRAGGLSSENDVLEALRSGRGVGPLHAALAERRPAGAARSDPGLADAQRSTLHARLGREPSASELEAERRAFDARIAQVNQALAAKRPDIAQAIARDRAFPRALEASALGLRPPDPQSSGAEAREGMRALYQTLLAR